MHPKYIFRARVRDICLHLLLPTSNYSKGLSFPEFCPSLSFSKFLLKIKRNVSIQISEVPQFYTITALAMLYASVLLFTFSFAALAHVFIELPLAKLWVSMIFFEVKCNTEI